MGGFSIIRFDVGVLLYLYVDLSIFKTGSGRVPASSRGLVEDLVESACFEFVE